MGKVTVLVMVVAFAVSVSAGNSRIDLARSQRQGSEKALNDEGRPAIRVTIMTGGGLFGPAKDRYKVGEQVPCDLYDDQHLHTTDIRLRL